ncbi:MAG TPA: histidinol dehydrogenase, partial [Natronincola sp.]|nr:histidinol dehydrogenase [Natronincola sp.]
NLKKFAIAQMESLQELKEIEVMPGVFAGHRVLPMDSCCCYVPGGEYPLFSSALMLITPAKVAGVKRIAACSPTMRGTTKINAATLVAMDLAGVDEIYAVGGAHAIAAFAYGTEQIKPVDVIVGPGNQYVTEAKRQCFGQVGIDFIAGPSEVLVIADDSANPEIIAADLLSQAEHDLLARSILITLSEELGQKVLKEVEKQLETLPTNEIANVSWENNGEIIVVDSLEEACKLSDEYAPEHLEIMVEDLDAAFEQLNNYGSLFIGEFAAEVFGDYLSGTNHALPTSRAARYTGGVWVGSFTKVCTHQRLTEEGLRSVSEPTILMAEAEGLYGHSNSAKVRIKSR